MKYLDLSSHWNPCLKNIFLSKYFVPKCFVWIRPKWNKRYNLHVLVSDEFAEFSTQIMNRTKLTITFAIFFPLKLFFLWENINNKNYKYDFLQGCHLAFLKLFARNRMVLPFRPFLNVHEISILKTCFWKIWVFLLTFFEIPILNLVL